MRWGVLLVGVLAVTAGCSALGGGGDAPTPTVTPAPVPTVEQTATATSTPGVAPGVETTGIANLSTLADGHVRAARNTSWVWHESSRVNQTTGNVTVTTRSNQTIWFEGPRTYRRQASLMSIRVASEVQFFQDYEEYANGDTGYRTYFSPEEKRLIYERDDAPAVGPTFAGFATDPITDYLALETATVSRIDVGERPHYLVVGSQPTVPEYGPVTTYRARAVVREDGFVRQLNVTFTVQREDLTVEGYYNFSYRRVGNATVERPDWVDTAQNETGSPNETDG